ncbi:hypothetical protein Tco_1146311 [Tanacetum coccineum]
MFARGKEYKGQEEIFIGHEPKSRPVKVQGNILGIFFTWKEMGREESEVSRIDEVVRSRDKMIEGAYVGNEGNKMYNKYKEGTLYKGMTKDQEKDWKCKKCPSNMIRLLEEGSRREFKEEFNEEQPSASQRKKKKSKKVRLLMNEEERIYYEAKCGALFRKCGRTGSNGEWDTPEYHDTTDSGKNKEAKTFTFYRMETEDISERYDAPCFVNGLEAYDGEINLEHDKNLISNEFVVKLCLEHEVKNRDKVVKKELIVALRGEIYFMKFIINLEEDDIELE